MAERDDTDKGKRPAREAELAAALRANLRRRKAVTGTRPARESPKKGETGD